MEDYIYKTVPRKHQKKFVEETWNLPYFAVFWEMRVGKTKAMIDNIAYLYEKDLVDGALIIAPNGVDINWALDEIPIHLPKHILDESNILRYSSKKGGQVGHKKEVKANLEHRGLSWLLMSYDAFMTDNGKSAGINFLDKRKVFYVLDESVCIKSPGAKRTMRITRTAYRSKYRRVLDGYPSPKGAFDLYSQIKFLDDNFWSRHGWDNFAAFKSYFGVFETKHNYGTGNDYEQFLGYQNLEELNKLIAPISSRLLQRDVLDIPPKNYEFRYFELTSQQRQMYDELQNEYKIWLESGQLVTASMVMVRELRLQQISCGYLPIGDGEPIHMIDGKNPRLELMEGLLENQTEPSIIWARYKMDIELISDMLRSKKNCKFALYTGDTSDEDRIRAKQGFQRGDFDYFVGTPSAAARGLTLDKARNTYYYSNSYNLMHRKQSEERGIADGQTWSHNVFDLVGLNTRDKSIIMNLCGKMDTSDTILGDKLGHDIRSQLGNWLE